MAGPSRQMKVMQIENDYTKEVYNGDIGYINVVDTETSELRATSIAHRHRWFRRTRHAGVGLRHDHSQVAGIRISRRGDSTQHPALRDAGAQSPVHRVDARQTARRAGRSTQGIGHRRSEGGSQPALIEAERVA
jgi:hypothetical protein